ncbi:GMC oxidoreductase [Glonium stellatum]|uniref:GMC oxidoreductase n=1 Tax=Glonium stellatum TaxID=574774 RepID=A0A8E2ETA1_9PEZI|nr:GMC oxidoreductase [Glonium stellatum]
MSAENFSKKSYDYVIVGGGTAGLTIAARLSEDENVSVAVLEAGGNRLNDLMVDAPNLFLQLWDKPEYDWSYQTIPQKGTGNRVHGWARGKCLGGSSAINYTMFSMCSRQDLDNWAELGNNGWGFDDMIPYFRKFETYNPPSKELSTKINSQYLDPLLRGTNGPVQEVWPQTCINLGYPQPKDPRSGSAIGGFNQLTTVDPKLVRRSYSARAYYEPNAHRPNLSVLTDALVSKIEFEKTTPYSGSAKATSVQFTVAGIPYTVNVKKEVIICGGTINSPQILELSGIGSASLLQKHGVNVVYDNPNVGENLNDHSATGLCFEVEDGVPTAEMILRDESVAQQAMEAYMMHKAGPLANAPTTCGFIPFSTIAPSSVISDPKSHIHSVVSSYLKSHPNTDPAGRDALLARQLLNPNEAVCQVVPLSVGVDVSRAHHSSGTFVHETPGNWCTIAVCSTRSFSRGSVHISSADPTAHPLIDPAYFTHPLDVDIAARSVLHAKEIVATEPFRSKLKKDANGNLIPMPSMPVPNGLDEAMEFARNNTVTEYHPIGTCAMLPKEKGGVVDQELRVYGTSNVRVCDASIFPLHVQGNIVSLVYAVAEKGADLIKDGKGVMDNIRGCLGSV